MSAPSRAQPETAPATSTKSFTGTAQIYAPFDVQVQRIYGNGSFDSSSNGNTTIFIGDKSGNGTGVNNVAYAYTPWAYMDSPGDVRGINHRPNSDPYDLAYVDPNYGSSALSWNNRTIARAVAHQAGHTFGLMHVLSSPDQEVMSYDATNTRFFNKTFNITTLNNNGTSTSPDSLTPAEVAHQYSHLALWEHSGAGEYHHTELVHVLASRTRGRGHGRGFLPNVADTSAVDSTYVDAAMRKSQRIRASI